MRRNDSSILCVCWYPRFWHSMTEDYLYHDFFLYSRLRLNHNNSHDIRNCYHTTSDCHSNSSSIYHHCYLNRIHYNNLLSSSCSVYNILLPVHSTYIWSHTDHLYNRNSNELSNYSYPCCLLHIHCQEIRNNHFWSHHRIAMNPFALIPKVTLADNKHHCMLLPKDILTLTIYNSFSAIVLLY